MRCMWTDFEWSRGKYDRFRVKLWKFLLRVVNLLSPLSNFVMERTEAWQLIQLYNYTKRSNCCIVKRKLYFRARITNFEILMLLSTLIFVHSKIDSYTYNWFVSNSTHSDLIYSKIIGFPGAIHGFCADNFPDTFLHRFRHIYMSLDTSLHSKVMCHPHRSRSMNVAKTEAVSLIYIY